jgi:hypothetical protein
VEVQRSDENVTVRLTGHELYVLRRALERASFIDTPASEQAEIVAFCTRALETLPRTTA